MMPYGYFKKNSYTYLWPNFVVGYSFLWFSVDPKLTYSHLRLNLLKAISQLKIIVLFKGKVLILYQLSIYLVATFYAYYLCRKHKKMEIYFELYQMMSIWRKRIQNPYIYTFLLDRGFWKNPDGVLWSSVVFVVVVVVTLYWPPMISLNGYTQMNFIIRFIQFMSPTAMTQMSYFFAHKTVFSGLLESKRYCAEGFL